MQVEEFEAFDISSTDRTLLFNGKKAHFVTPFSGERYSVIFYTDTAYLRVQHADKAFLQEKAEVLWPCAAKDLELTASCRWLWHPVGREPCFVDESPRSRSRSRSRGRADA